MNVLEAIDVTKIFREGSESVTVLRGTSLSLDAGEIVALEGPSGSGKTTFLTILGCMLTPSSGRVNIEGRGVDPARPDLLPGSPRVDRVRVPAVQPVPGADGDGEHRVRHEPEGLPGPGRAARGRVFARRGRPDRPRPDSCPATSPGARSNGSRLPGPWPVDRRSSWPTNQQPTSTPRPACRSWDCSASSPNASGAPKGTLLILLIICTT